MMQSEAIHPSKLPSYPFHDWVSIKHLAEMYFFLIKIIEMKITDKITDISTIEMFNDAAYNFHTIVFVIYK